MKSPWLSWGSFFVVLAVLCVLMYLGPRIVEGFIP